MVVRRELKTENTYGATFTFEVEPGKYRLLFWADYIDAGAVADVNGYYADKYYNTKESATLYQGLKAVTINSAAYEINTEFRDAFYASCDFVKESGKGLLMDKQILERAMAKLILTERSEQAFKASKSLSVTYTVPSVFSVEKGSRQEQMCITFLIQICHWWEIMMKSEDILCAMIIFLLLRQVIPLEVFL